MPLVRSVSWLLVFALPGAAGWFGGRWAHEGLMPAGRAPSRTVPQTLTIRDPSSQEGKWMARVMAAAPGDFANLLDELDTVIPKGTHFEAREAAIKWLLGLWISRDPEAAAAYVAERKDDLLGSNFGLALGSVAPGKVEAVLKGPLGKAFGKYFASAVMRSLSAADPREYVRLSEETNSKSLPRYWKRALSALAATDPEGAASIWSSRQLKGKEQALFAILGVWVQRNPGAARKWAESLEDPNARHFAQHAWVAALARQDLPAARQALTSLDPGDWIGAKPYVNGFPAELYPTDAHIEIAAATARRDLPAALADFAALAAQVKAPPGHSPGEDKDGSQRSDPLRQMRCAIVEAAAPSLPDDPAALLAALKNLESASATTLDAKTLAEIESDLLLKKLRNGGAANSLEAVRLLTLQGGGDYATVAAQLVSDAAQHDPAQTVEFIGSLPEDQRGSLAAAAFGIINASDPSLMIRAAALVPADQWTVQMGRQLGQMPAQSAGVVGGLPVNVTTNSARQGFAEMWAKQDPQAATQWIAALPQDAGATQAARGVADAWARYDDSAASAWVATMPQGPARDGAALGLSSSVAAAEPEAAWKWAASISSSVLSADAYWNVARQWGRNAPPEFRTAFSSALDAAGYAGDIKTKALADLDKPPGKPAVP